MCNLRAIFRIFNCNENTENLFPYVLWAFQVLTGLDIMMSQSWAALFYYFVKLISGPETYEVKTFKMIYLLEISQHF